MRIKPAPLKFASFLMAMILSVPVVYAATGSVTWYKFRKQFIADHYAGDSAFGVLTAEQWTAAKSVHSTSCGGSDGELHIGIPENAIQASGQHPVSANAGVTSPDADWGLVAELPNASEGGPEELNAQQGNQLTFGGYFRLWDEGHAHGSAAPSNPHHVLELHPSWAFGPDSSSFVHNDPALVKSIPGYSGYGASKFKPIFQTLESGEWLNVWQDDDFVYVQLRESPNFHQVPVQINEVRSVTGGHEVVVNVFSDKNFSHLVHEHLRVITANGSPIDDDLARASVGDQMFLLGFFSVNLQNALQLSQSARTEADAVSVPDALELFAFGPATQNAVSTCRSH